MQCLRSLCPGFWSLGVLSRGTERLSTLTWGWILYSLVSGENKAIINFLVETRRSLSMRKVTRVVAYLVRVALMPLMLVEIRTDIYYQHIGLIWRLWEELGVWWGKIEKDWGGDETLMDASPDIAGRGGHVSEVHAWLPTVQVATKPPLCCFRKGCPIHVFQKLLVTHHVKSFWEADLE